MRDDAGPRPLLPLLAATAPGYARATMRVARFGFGAVVLAAGVSGVALLTFPGSTGSFFSWNLGPPPLASLIGGFYVASSLTFGMALLLPWQQVRSLVAAATVLTAPTFVATMVHIEVFDLDRWQAWFWILLFAGAPWFWAGLLVANHTAREPEQSRARGPRTAALALIAVVLAAVAVVVLIDPARAARPMPFDFSPMGGRFLGAWLAFFAIMAAWAAFRPKETGLPFVALVSYSLGALVAGFRSVHEMDSSPGRYIYLAALLLGCFVFATAAGRRLKSLIRAAGRRHAVGNR